MRLENQTGESMTIFLRDSVVAPAVPTPGAALLAGRAPSPIHERVGAYEIRLATTARELRQAQRLRYAVFYEDGGAMASAAAASVRRDLCPFDAICDHLIVVDTEAVSRVGARKPRVVGTYRLLRREVAERHGGFYSQGEFDLAPLMAAHPRARLLELGRSCVQANYRAKRVIELLWRGLWLYASHFGVDALIGCASLSGTDLAALDLPLSFLLRCAQADDDWQVAALPHRAAKFTARPENEIDQRRAPRRAAAAGEGLHAHRRALRAECGDRPPIRDDGRVRHHADVGHRSALPLVLWRGELRFGGLGRINAA